MTIEIDIDGTITFSSNNVYHREDGPAIIDADGTKHWFINGKRHREYAPAIIWPTGEEFWWINHKGISVNEWIEENNYPHWTKWDDVIKMHFKLTFL